MARGKDNTTQCRVVLTGEESSEMMEVSRQASNLAARPQPRAESWACRAEHTEELLSQKRIRSVNSSHSLSAKHLKCIIPCSITIIVSQAMKCWLGEGPEVLGD